MNEALEFLRQFETWQLALGGFAAVGGLAGLATGLVLWLQGRAEPEQPPSAPPPEAEVVYPEFRSAATRAQGQEDVRHLLSMMRHALATRKVSLMSRYTARLRAAGWERLPATVEECDDMMRALAAEQEAP